MKVTTALCVLMGLGLTSASVLKGGQRSEVTSSGIISNTSQVKAAIHPFTSTSVVVSVVTAGATKHATCVTFTQTGAACVRAFTSLAPVRASSALTLTSTTIFPQAPILPILTAISPLTTSLDASFSSILSSPSASTATPVASTITPAVSTVNPAVASITPAASVATPILPAASPIDNFPHTQSVATTATGHEIEDVGEGETSEDIQTSETVPQDKEARGTLSVGEELEIAPGSVWGAAFLPAVLGTVLTTTSYITSYSTSYTTTITSATASITISYDCIAPSVDADYLC